MEKISDAMGKALGNISGNPEIQPRQQQHSESASNPLPDDKFEQYLLRLWVVMMETWGHKWTSSMGPEPNGTWKQGLRDLSEQEWLRGIQVLNNTTEHWPPSMPEFRNWCTGAMTGEELRAWAEEEAERRLVGNYNPNVTPLSHDQLARERQVLARRLVVQRQDNERRRLLGLEQVDDPLRICQDEEYR